MTTTLINQSKTDIAKSMIDSPLYNSLYFFFGSIDSWSDNFAILDITSSNPAEVTVISNHDIEVGETIKFNNVNGMIQINGMSGTVTNVIDDVIYVDIDTTAFTAFTEGGYVSIKRTGKPEEFTVDRNRYQIAGLKQVTGDKMSYVIPRNNWTKNKKYDAFDPEKDLSNKIFHVFVDNNIYICLDNASGAFSTYKPSGTSDKAIHLSDGYTWKFVQTVNSEMMTKFGDADWIPVRDEVNKLSGVRNSIESIQTITSGTGYTHVDTISILGDGEGAEAIIGRFTSFGAIQAVNTQKLGKNYTWANAYINSSTGSGAVLKPIISRNYGVGSDPLKDLYCRHVKFRFEVNGDEDGRLYVGPIFTIGMLRFDSSFEEKEFVDPRSSILVESNGEAFNVGETITGQISKASAIVAGVSETEIKYLNRQGPNFQAGEIITSGTKSAVSNSIDEFDISVFDDSDIIFMDNFDSAYNRNSNQTDVFNIVIGY